MINNVDYEQKMRRIKIECDACKTIEQKRYTKYCIAKEYYKNNISEWEYKEYLRLLNK